jgi:hypothetical protein
MPSYIDSLHWFHWLAEHTRNKKKEERLENKQFSSICAYSVTKPPESQNALQESGVLLFS